MELVFWHSCSKQGFSVSDLPIHSHTFRNLTYLINVLFSWQSLLFQVCSCSYSPLNPFFIKYCTINSEKNSCMKKVDKMCHHWKGIKEACESTLSFSEDARAVFSSPSPAFFETALVKHSLKLPEYLLFGWYFLLGPIFLRPLLLRLKNFFAITCQSSWQANGAGADTEAAFGFVCFCRLPCLCVWTST